MDESASVTPTRVIWNRYREATFAKHGRVWTWAAGQLFDFDAVAVLVLEIPEFTVTMAGHALVLRAYDEQHFVPIAQATAQTMCDVQLLVKARQANLLAELNVETTRRLDENQCAAEARLIH